MKRLFIILTVALLMVSLLNACGDMTGMNGYVSSSPSPNVTLVPSAAPSAAPKESASPTESASPKESASPSSSASPMPSDGADSTSAPSAAK